MGPGQRGDDGTGRGFSLAGYVDLTEIGRGGSSRVFRAWQADFSRWVAIKVVPISSDTTPLSQFQRERRAIGMLSGHPSIVTVHDGGVAADGTAYIVMEYLPDGTYADRLRQGSVSWPEAVTTGIMVCGALESAHRVGVLHLDVKPENLFVSGDFDTVKLGDFGISRIRGSAETKRQVVSGTLLHIAPERLRDGPPIAASDVYSLGSTLFTLIAGHPPFGRPGEPDGVVMARLLGDRPPVPDLGVHGLPLPFCRVIEDALAQDPRGRPASAGELGERLRTAQAAEGLDVTPMLVRGPSAAAPPAADPRDGPPTQGAHTLPPTPTPLEVDSPVGGPGQPPPPVRGAPRRRLVRATIAGSALVAAATLAVVSAGIFDDRHPAATTTGTPATGTPATTGMPATTGTPATAGTPTSPAPTVGGLGVFQDDFSDPASGWTRDAQNANYDAGAYRIRLATGPTRRAIAAPDDNPVVHALTLPGTTAVLEVDVKFVEPNTFGWAGLYCRSQPETKDRYQAEVSPDGVWHVTKDSKDGGFVTLDEATQSRPAVAGAAYHLRFECATAGRATQLALEVDGVLVSHVNDDNGLDGGSVGVVATSFHAPGVDAFFDDFLATSR